MIKTICLSSILLFLIVCCHRGNNIQSVKDVPDWLQSKIDTMSSYEEYEGTILYRYKWKGAYVYHFDIPNSTCKYCAMYVQSGDTLYFANEPELQDFLHKKTDEEFLWEWRRNL